MGRVGYLSAREGEEEEEKGPDEFTAASHEVISGCVVQAVCERQSLGPRL